MGIIVTILTVFDVLVAILIIALVLVQQSKKGGGLGTTFGGGGSDSLFGAHASSHLSKLTVVFATMFLVVTLALAVISGRGIIKQNDSSLNTLLAQQSSSDVSQPSTSEGAVAPATDTSAKK